MGDAKDVKKGVRKSHDGVKQRVTEVFTFQVGLLSSTVVHVSICHLCPRVAFLERLDLATLPGHPSDTILSSPKSPLTWFKVHKHGGFLTKAIKLAASQTSESYCND